MEGRSYEVFLSYYRRDIRAGFADHLCTYLTDAGVRTFIGEEDINIGEEIGPTVLKVVEQSKISIPIFSQNYASSKWLLRELVQMKECWKRKAQVIMPIFYHVKPSEVRCQTGGFGGAFLSHKIKRRVDEKSICEWGAALEEVGGLNGWDTEHEAHRLEGQLVVQVVAGVLHELNKANLVDSDLLELSREFVKMAQGIPLPLEMEGCVCEVFLSFRGSDTRMGFTDHLYTRLKGAGVRTYIKNEDLLTGKENGPDLLRAIEQSKISIVIFSENYVSSRCCLEELAQMVDCRKMGRQVIMPIFYYVSPTDLQVRYGNCREEAFFSHEIKKQVDDEKIPKWKAALYEVRSLRGWNVSSGADREGLICKEVVAGVLRVLGRQSVGIEHHGEKVLSQVKFRGPANTEQSSFKGVNYKYEGNEGSIDNSRELKIGKISLSGKIIGKGSNGTIVIEGKYEERPAAVKRLLLDYCDVADNEIDKLRKSDLYDNIVRYYGFERDQNFVYLALELCTCTLDDLIHAYSDSSNNLRDDPAAIKASVRDTMQDFNLRRVDGRPSPTLLDLMRNMVSGLGQLHGLGIIHRDLKPTNVLITKIPFRAKLSDMGMSRCLPDGRSSLGYHATSCGTKGYQAPEVSRDGGRQTQAMDLFSLGCVLFFCITCGRHLFGENIASNNPDLFLVEDMPEAHDLISRLLSQNPESRPKASEVLHHPFWWDSERRLSFLHDISDKIEWEFDEYIKKIAACSEVPPVLPSTGGSCDPRMVIPDGPSIIQKQKNKIKWEFKEYLKKINNKKKSEVKKYDLPFLEALEKTKIFIFPKKKWDHIIDDEVMTDLRLQGFGTYEGELVKDLLRAVRNKVSHHWSAPEEVQNIYGGYPDGLDAYLARKFPRLLIESYEVASKFCKDDDLLKKKKYFHFRGSE